MLDSPCSWLPLPPRKMGVAQRALGASVPLGMCRWGQLRLLPPVGSASSLPQPATPGSPEA